MKKELFVLITFLSIIFICSMTSLVIIKIPITGYTTTPTGTVKVSIGGVLSITFVNATIDFQNGSVNLNASYAILDSDNVGCVNGSWPTVDSYFLLENDGNFDANVTIKSANGKAWIGGASALQKYEYKWQDDVSPGELDSCALAGSVENTYTEFAAANTEYALCENLTAANDNDTIEINLRVQIPNDAPAGNQTDTITFTATNA